MTLYLIGIGLYDEKDITLRGFEFVKKCSRVYLEWYTSRLQCDLSVLERLYGKPVIPLYREDVENRMSEVLDEAAKSDIALLVVGSPFAATTHIEFLFQARKRKVKVKIVENASILTAVGVTGLSLYKFGRVTTIPFENKSVTSPYETIQLNQKHGLHTLVLLDIQGDRLMTVQEGLKYLFKQGLSQGQLCVACAALGSPEQFIRVMKANELVNLQGTKFPQCLIVPGELNFKEEEVLKLYQ